MEFRISKRTTQIPFVEDFSSARMKAASADKNWEGRTDEVEGSDEKSDKGRWTALSESRAEKWFWESRVKVSATLRQRKYCPISIDRGRCSRDGFWFAFAPRSSSLFICSFDESFWWIFKLKYIYVKMWNKILKKEEEKWFVSSYGILFNFLLFVFLYSCYSFDFSFFKLFGL